MFISFLHYRIFMELVPLGNPVMRYRSMLIFPLRNLRRSCLHKHHGYTQIAIALEPDEYSRHINDVWWVIKKHIHWQILTSLCCQVCIRQTNDQLIKFRLKSLFEKISHGQSAPYILVVWYRYMPKHLQTLRWPTSEHFYRRHNTNQLYWLPGPLLQTWLNLGTSMVSNDMPSKVWDEITFQLFSLWGLGMDKVIAPYFIMHVITYPYWRWY